MADSIQLHLDIQNSLEEDFKKTHTAAKDLNESIADATKGLRTSSNLADKISDSYDDIEPKSKSISHFTQIWRNSLGKVKDVVSLLATGFTTIFSVAAMADMIATTVRLNQEMIDLSFRMGDAGRTANSLAKSVTSVAKATGITTDQSMELIKVLRGYRVSARDISALGMSIGHFHKITGLSIDSATRLGGELSKVGRLGAKSIDNVMKAMASVQRTVGLTVEEMESLTDATIYSTRMLGQMGKSSGFIEDFQKGTVKLAGAFASVGVEASKATDFIKQLLDPGKIEDNALLYAKLGISINDAISGNVDPGQLAAGFKNLGAEIKSMSPVAGAALSEALGMPLQDLRAMADMSGNELVKNFGSLESMSKEQKGPQRDFEETLNSIKTTLVEIGTKLMPVINAFSKAFAGSWSKVSGVVEKFADSLSGKLKPTMDKLIEFISSGKLGEWFGKIFNVIKGFASPKLWLAALAILFIVISKVRKKFFAMASDVGEKIGISTQKGLAEASQSFGDNIQTATEEALVMASKKASTIASMQKEPSARKTDLENRIVGGEDYKRIQGIAELYDTMAQSNLFPAVARSTEKTAEWLRDISMGAKPLSLLGQMTEKNNKQIENRLKMAKHDNVVMKEKYSEQMEYNKVLYKELSDRKKILDALKASDDISSSQTRELKKINKELDKQVDYNEKIGELQTKYEKTEERVLNRMSKIQKKMYYDSLKSKKKEIDDSMEALRTRQGNLEVENKILESKKKSLEIEKINTEAIIQSGNASLEVIEAHDRIKKTLQEVGDELRRNENENSMITTDMAEQVKEINSIETQMGKLVSAAGMTAESFEKIDIPLRPNVMKKTMDYVGSTFRKAGSAIGHTFDKAKNSIVQIKDNIAQKLKPENWLKSIKSGIRGFSDKTGTMLSKSMGGLGKLMNKLAIPMILLGAVMKALKPIMKDLKPIFDQLIGIFVELLTKIFYKLAPPLLRFMAKLLPPFASLINFLLPLLLKVLSLVANVIQKLMGVLENVAMTFLKTGYRIKAAIMSAFGGKDDLREEIINRANEKGLDPESIKKILGPVLEKQQEASNAASQKVENLMSGYGFENFQQALSFMNKDSSTLTAEEQRKKADMNLNLKPAIQAAREQQEILDKLQSGQNLEEIINSIDDKKLLRNIYANIFSETSIAGKAIHGFFGAAQDLFGGLSGALDSISNIEFFSGDTTNKLVGSLEGLADKLDKGPESNTNVRVNTEDNTGDEASAQVIGVNDKGNFYEKDPAVEAATSTAEHTEKMAGTNEDIKDSNEALVGSAKEQENLLNSIYGVLSEISASLKSGALQTGRGSEANNVGSTIQ